MEKTDTDKVTAMVEKREKNKNKKKKNKARFPTARRTQTLAMERAPVPFPDGKDAMTCKPASS